MEQRLAMTEVPKAPRWRRISGYFGRWFAPGYSACGRCRRPWKFCDGHSTRYSDSHGCFPLCEQCWLELTVEQRMPFYRYLVWGTWASSYCSCANCRPELESLWNEVEQAVLAGR